MLYGFVLLRTWHSPSSHIHSHNLGAKSPNMHMLSTNPPPAARATCTHRDEDKVIATSPPLYFIHFFAKTRKNTLCSLCCSVQHWITIFVFVRVDRMMSRVDGQRGSNIIWFPVARCARRHCIRSSLLAFKSRVKSKHEMKAKRGLWKAYLVLSEGYYGRGWHQGKRVWQEKKGTGAWGCDDH